MTRPNTKRSASATPPGTRSRAPNRCINLVKSTNYNISRGRIIDIVQMRQYIAETSAKVMGARLPSQPKLQLQ